MLWEWPLLLPALLASGSGLCTMKLKKLEILGFKSFRDKTPIDLSFDINAIVGPNGCGKSNIVDAIRWVMGEQRVTTLRGKKMDDVIFNGSDDAPAVGMAEVSITLESNGRQVPEKYAGYREVTVSRKIFREGEGEYYINKVPCRLLDVREFFMDAGVGARTYSIVEQDKISSLVEAKPEERRRFIEEAAGIMKYKTRRDSASRKMEATRQNILRVNDIQREVRSQLNATSRQAKRADSYRTLKKNIKECQLSLSLQNYSKMASKIKELEHLRIPLDEKSLGAQTELKSLESAVEDLRAQLIESEDLIGTLQDKYYSVKNEINIREQKIEFANETISQLGDQKTRNIEEIGSLSERKKTTVEETSLLQHQTTESDKTITNLKDSIAYDQEAADIRKATEVDLSEKMESSKSRHIDTITENARLSNLLLSLTKNLEDLKRKAERECGGIDENNKKLIILRNNLSTVESDLSQDIEKVELLKRKENSTGEKLAAARNNLDAAVESIATIREQTGVKTSRLASLKQLQERHEWCDEGTRHVLEAVRNRALGGNIRGLVADYIKVPKEYESTVETVLDDKLQYVIVGNQNDGMNAIDYLKKHSSGRGTFVPLDSRMTPSLSKQDCPEGTSRLCDLVHATDEDFGRVVHRLLEDILLVPDLNTAMRLWQDNNFTGTYVTPKGDIIRPNGALTGGSENNGSSSLGGRREITELEKQIDELAHVFEAKNENKDKLSDATSLMETEVTQLRTDIHELELEINSRRKDIERLESEIKWIEQRIDVIAFNRESLESEKTLNVENTVDVKVKIASLKGEVEAGDKRILSIQEKWKEARTELEEGERNLTEKKILLTSVEEKAKSGIETLSRLEGTVAEIDGRIESITEDVDACEAKTAEAMESVDDEGETLKLLYKHHADAEDNLSEKREFHVQKNVIYKQKELEIQKARKRSEGFSRQLGEKEMETREAVIQAEVLKESVHEKLDVDLDSLLPQFQTMGESDAQKMRKRLESHKKRLEEFGEVNLLAISEHEELKERHDFLAAQIKDLNSSLDTLQKTITRIDQISKKRFSETFEAVNHHFRNVFPRLFPGGKGSLCLTDEADMLETGVDIDMLIPGKKKQNLSLLSGGEKALAAVALIFAILMHRPSPFLILDEADAPLDDVNVSLFRDLVKDIAENSQIIFITHNKGSMAAADNLIGVTMEKHGISTTVSVNMN